MPDLLCVCDREWFDSHQERDGFQRNFLRSLFGCAVVLMDFRAPE